MDGLLLAVLQERPEGPSCLLVCGVVVVVLDGRDFVPPLLWKEKRGCECVSSVREKWQCLDRQVEVDDQCGLCSDRFLVAHAEDKFVPHPLNVELLQEEVGDQSSEQNDGRWSLGP